MLPRVAADNFEIEEYMKPEEVPLPEVDPWSEDPRRLKQLRECYEIDLPKLHLDDLCHAEEEEELKQTIWQIYPRFFETYAIFAGRSAYPLIRQVDVYGFFEDTQLLDRESTQQRLPSTPPDQSDSAASAMSLASRGRAAHPISLQDVQQMLVQTIAPRKALYSGAKRHSLAQRAAAVAQRTREGAPVTRPQFFEVLLRAAIALRSAKEPSTALALRRFTQDILCERIMQVPLSLFPRGLILQAGIVRDALLSRRKTLREAYERYGGSENLFQQLAQQMKLCDSAFTAKHVSSIFSLARRPQADFMRADAQGGLAFDEFCESVSRLALIWQRGPRAGGQPGDRRSFPPQPRVGVPIQERAMASKLEAFLAQLAQRMKPRGQ